MAVEVMHHPDRQRLGLQVSLTETLLNLAERMVYSTLKRMFYCNLIFSRGYATRRLCPSVRHAFVENCVLFAHEPPDPLRYR